jgi:pseudouridine kinase
VLATAAIDVTGVDHGGREWEDRTVRSSQVVVIGGINADVTGRSREPIVPRTSNPGTVSLTPGGAGRNVAEGLARLGVEVRLAGSVGEDEFGRAVLSRTREAGVDVSGVRVGAGSTGVYLSVVDTDGAMQVAVADMPAAEHTDASLVGAALERLPQPGIVVVDTNVPAEAIEAALEVGRVAGALTVVLAVSVPKLRRLGGVRRGCDWLLLNAEEYAAFNGPLEPNGVLVTKGAEGVDHLNASGRRIESYPAVPVRLVDENGAGDAFAAGFCAALALGKASSEAPGTAVRMGTAAAAVTAEAVGTVPEVLTLEQVEAYIERSSV